MRIIQRLTLATLLGVAFSFAQTPHPVQDQHTQTAGNKAVMVWLTPKGKTYHTWRDCIGLERSKQVLISDEATAEQHGLTLCGICAHRHHVQSKTLDWAKPEVTK